MKAEDWNRMPATPEMEGKHVLTRVASENNRYALHNSYFSARTSPAVTHWMEIVEPAVEREPSYEELDARLKARVLELNEKDTLIRALEMELQQTKNQLQAIRRTFDSAYGKSF